MSALTAPFDGAWEALAAGPVRVLTSVTLLPATGPEVALEIVNGTVTFDEDSSPYVRCNLQMAVPESQALLDALDPRKGARIRIDVGYAVPGRTESHTLATLRLFERTVNRPDNTMNLIALSGELVIQEQTPLLNDRVYVPGQLAGPVIEDLIRWTVPTPTINRTLGDVAFIDAGDTFPVTRGSSIWSAIQNIADRAGALVFEDGLGVWNIIPQRTLAGSASASLRVGPGGTITGSQTVLSRDEFYNTVLVKYAWNDGEPRTAFGYAEVTSGDLSVAVAGRHSKTVVIERSGTAAQAAEAARQMLYRAASRGRQMSLEVGRALFWLRPGQTVTVQLPTGPQERHLVSRVEFDIPSGTMNLRTRVPEDVVITKGE